MNRKMFNGVLKSRPKRAFFSPKVSKVDDLKIKRKVSPFFPSSTRLSSLIILLSLFFFLVYMTWKKPKSLVQSRLN